MNPARISHRSISTASTVSSFRRDRMSVTVRPSDEKSLSDCAQLATSPDLLTFLRLLDTTRPDPYLLVNFLTRPDPIRPNPHVLENLLTRPVRRVIHRASYSLCRILTENDEVDVGRVWAVFVGDGDGVLGGVFALSSPTDDSRRVLGACNFHVLSDCLQNSWTDWHYDTARSAVIPVYRQMLKQAYTAAQEICTFNLTVVCRH